MYISCYAYKIQSMHHFDLARILGNSYKSFPSIHLIFFYLFPTAYMLPCSQILLLLFMYSGVFIAKSVLIHCSLDIPACMYSYSQHALAQMIDSNSIPLRTDESRQEKDSNLYDESRQSMWHRLIIHQINQINVCENLDISSRISFQFIDSMQSCIPCM